MLLKFSLYKILCTFNMDAFICVPVAQAVKHATSQCHGFNPQRMH